MWCPTMEIAISESVRVIFVTVRHRRHHADAVSLVLSLVTPPGVEHFLTATSIFIQPHLARPQAQQHKLNKEVLRSNGHYIQSLGTERRFWIP